MKFGRSPQATFQKSAMLPDQCASRDLRAGLILVFPCPHEILTCQDVQAQLTMKGVGAGSGCLSRCSTMINCNQWMSSGNPLDHGLAVRLLERFEAAVTAGSNATVLRLSVLARRID